MFHPTEVGLTNGGVELDRQGYRRQPFAHRVNFGPAQGGPWGMVDGVFIIEGDKKFKTAIRPILVKLGNTLDIEINVDFRGN